MHMQGKLIVGWILFVAGILLQVASDTFDLWIIGVFGGVLWPVGMVMGINASICIDRKKKNKGSSHKPTADEDN